MVAKPPETLYESLSQPSATTTPNCITISALPVVAFPCPSFSSLLTFFCLFSLLTSFGFLVLAHLLMPAFHDFPSHLLPMETWC